MEESRPFAGWSTRELTGHRRRVCTLAWSGNGKKLASGSADSTIRIWSPAPHASRPERSDMEIKAHPSAISHLAWKPGNHSDLLISSSSGDKNDKCIKLWDVRSGKCCSTANTSSGNLFVTWSPDGTAFAGINQDNVLNIVDARKAKVIKSQKFSKEIFEIMWGPTPNQLLLATEEGCVDVLAYPSLEYLWSFRGHRDPCYCLSLSPNNKLLATGGADALVTLWDLDDAVCVRSWYHMEQPVRALSTSMDNQYVAYATEMGELEVLSTVTGERVVELRLRAQLSDSVAWHPHHNLLAYCDEAMDPMSRDRSPIGIVGLFAPPKPNH